MFRAVRSAGTHPLPLEGHLPRFDGATTWINSPPLEPAGLQGKVVLIDFWTYTCINWLRTEPYIRAWSRAYRGDGLVVIGVHTPEFSFEHDLGNVRRETAGRDIDYPVAVDSDYMVWDAFANRYWPAIYVADTEGRIRYHHYGEGRYEESERILQKLLGLDRPLVEVEGDGAEAPADWDSLGSPETYLGYAQGERFASPGGVEPGRRARYSLPPSLDLNRWALEGDWTIGAEVARPNDEGARLAYRFRARDVHLVMGPTEGHGPVPFQVRVDGDAPGDAHGTDVDEGGKGTAAELRLHQLIRQRGDIEDRTFEIAFGDAGIGAYCFTFG